MITGLETGENGTPHIQGYVELVSKCSLTTLKGLVSRAHWSVARGTALHNKEYCSKQGVFEEVGVPMKQGSRTDLTAVVSSITSGMTIHQLWQEHPVAMIRNYNGLIRAYGVLSPHRAIQLPLYPLTAFRPWDLLVPAILNAMISRSVILVGASGLGKTSFAQSLLTRALFVSQIDTLTEYQQGHHDGIIFDDMDFRHLPRSSQIHIVDLEQTRSIYCRYNNATIERGVKRIFTTNLPDIFIDDPAIARRCQKFILGPRE